MDAPAPPQQTTETGTVESRPLPSPEILAEIARRQDANAADIRAAREERRRSKELGAAAGGEEESRRKAAMLIQKNYRGHRTRRAMQGRGLSSEVRWMEALKEGRCFFGEDVQDAILVPYGS